MAIIVDVADAAERDLIEIADYLTREASPSIAGRWVRRIEERIAALAEFPYAGAEDGRLGRGRRRLVERPYLIVYRILGPERVRVVHGDLPALFKDDKDLDESP